MVKRKISREQLQQKITDIREMHKITIFEAIEDFNNSVIDVEAKVISSEQEIERPNALRE